MRTDLTRTLDAPDSGPVVSGRTGACLYSGRWSRLSAATVFIFFFLIAGVQAQTLFNITGGTTNITNTTTQASAHPAANWYSTTPASAPTVSGTSTIISSSLGPYAYGNSSSNIPAGPGSGGNKVVFPGSIGTSSFSVVFTSTSLATIQNPMLKFNHILLGGNGNPTFVVKLNGTFGEIIVPTPIIAAGTWTEVTYLLPAQVTAATGNITLSITRSGGTNGANGAHFWALDDVSIVRYVDPCAGIPAGTFRWVGSGSGTANTSTDFDNPNNWCPVPTATSPLSGGHLQIFMTTSGTINLDANFTATSMEATVSGSSANFLLNVGTFALVVSGALSADVTSGDAGTNLEFRTGTGSLTVNGAASFGNATTVGKVGFGSLATTGTVNFNGAVTFGSRAGIYTSPPANLSFKGNIANNSTGLSFAGAAATLNGSAAQSVTGTQDLTFGNLTINNAQGVASTAINLTVNSALNMTAGVLQTSEQRQLLLGTSATLTESAGSYVNGYLTARRSISAVPQSFGGIGATITIGAGAYSTTVTRQTGTARAGSYTLNGVVVPSQSIKRVYTISVSGAPGDLGATLKFDFWNHELNGFSAAELVFFRENPVAPGNWIYKGKDEGLVMPTSTSAGSITLSGIKAFSTWTLGSSLNPLPVELIWFTAKRKNEAALLEWKTASEENNAGYQVEVSADNRTFQDLAFVAASESGSHGAQYAYTDEGASRFGTRYYRLSQHDHDGTKTVLGVRTVAFDAGTATLATGPNPFREVFTAVVESDRVQQATFTLTDALGRVVSRQVVQLEKGTNAVPFASQHLHTGLYILGLQLETELLSTRITRF